MHSSQVRGACMLWVKKNEGANGTSYLAPVNGADRAVTCTFDNSTTGEDITYAVAVERGDAVSIKLVSNDAADASEDVSAVVVLV